MENKIRVLKTDRGEYVTVKEVGMVTDQRFPMAQVQDPIFIHNDRIVIGEVVHVLGYFDDLIFTYEDFILFADGCNLETIDGDEARRIVQYLRAEKLF